MSKRLRIILICATAVFLLLAAAATLIYIKGYRKPYQSAESAMDPSGTMVLVHQADGQLILSWPECADAEKYQVEILKNETLLFDQYVEGLQCTLPELPPEDTLTVRVSSIRSYKYPFEDTVRLRKGTTDLEVTAVIAPPAVEALVRTDNTQTDTLHLQFRQQADSTVRFYLCNGPEDRKLLKTADDGQVSISFGEGGDLPELIYGEDMTFTYDCSRSIPGMDLYWYTNDQFSVCREDFLDRVLNLTLTDEGDNRFTLNWNETKGDHQLLQRWNETTGTWDTVQTYTHTDTLTYDTGYLPKYSHFSYRVIGVGGQTLPDSDYSTTPEEVEMTTGATALFATIWPIQALEVYQDAEAATVIGSVPEGKAFTVAEVRNGMFLIRYEGEKMGYVDSNYCMVNLPDYIGDRCLYHISNSFESRYMIHNYAIPEVTDEVTTGYENVAQSAGEYLVPLLYPTAKKLDQAATAALEQGYQLMIYDSYRPQKATLELYDIAAELMEEPLPPQDYHGEDGENAQFEDTLQEDPDATPVTYGMLMTDNGRYKLNFFLAKGGSRHNMGIALDLTLYDLATGQEVEMQTKMHDLSWYSEISQNNQPANLLADIMKGAGFGGLTSEWWHFQDNDALNDLKLTNYMYEGISAQCWVVDEKGWRYRRANGSYETGCTQTIDDITYSFDAQGYATATDDPTGEDLP